MQIYSRDTQGYESIKGYYSDAQKKEIAGNAVSTALAERMTFGHEKDVSFIQIVLSKLNN